MDGKTPGEEIAEHAYKRWWITSNRDAYTGSVMREVGREAYEVGRRAGREDAAREIKEQTETFCMDGVGRHLVACCVRFARGSQQPRTPIRGVGDNTEEQQQEGAAGCQCALVDVSTPDEPRYIRGRSDGCPVHDDGRAEAARQRAKDA